MSDLVDLLNAATASALAGVHTCLPGQIESYDHSRQRASVKPLLKKAYLDGKAESLPVIDGVPVVFPASSDFSFTYPLKDGDTVLLVFAERSMEKWLQRGGETEPGDPRKFDLTDAIALPGLKPFGGGNGLASLFNTVEGLVEGATDGQLTVHDAIAGLVPQIDQVTGLLGQIAAALDAPIPNTIGALGLLQEASTAIDGLRGGFLGVLPDLFGKIPQLSGAVPFLYGTQSGLVSVQTMLTGILPDTAGALGTITSMIGNMNSLSGVVNQVLPALGGLPDALNALGSGYATNNVDVRIRYKGFNMVINPDGRWAMGNDYDEFMLIVQEALGALCASICIPAGPLTHVPFLAMLFQRLLALRGNLNSLIPFVASVLPDALNTIGPDPASEVPDPALENGDD